MSALYNTTLPKPADTEPILFRKLLQVLGGSPQPTDDVYRSLWKILEQLTAAKANPADTKYALASKLLLQASSLSLPWAHLDSSNFDFREIAMGASTLTFPNLVSCGPALTIQLTQDLVTLSLPKLVPPTNCALDFSANTALRTLIFPNWSISGHSGYLVLDDCSQLVNLDVSLHVWHPDSTTNGISATNCPLSLASVNALLVRAATFIPTVIVAPLDPPEISLSGGTSAAPTGAGAAAKAALIAAGWTVITS